MISGKGKGEIGRKGRTMIKVKGKKEGKERGRK